MITRPGHGSRPSDPDITVFAQLNDQPGFHSGYTAAHKFSIAHELGHILIGMRTGAREVYDRNAPQDGCSGSFKDLTNHTDQSNRGAFTKEFGSTAFREGWGDFVAAVTWADDQATTCEFQSTHGYYDLDGDGVIEYDPTFAATVTRTTPQTTVDGEDLQSTYDCEGIPDLENISPAFPTIETYVTARNWLEDLVDADDNDVDGIQCIASTTQGGAAEAENRTTVHDVAALMWDLYSDQGLFPGELADVMVDACPRSWSDDDSGSIDSWPLNRIRTSADHHGFTTELDAEVDHVAH